MEEIRTYAFPQEGDIDCWLRGIANKGLRKELASRLRESDKGNRFSAIFELILYEFFTRRGYNLKRHPKIVDSEKTPDYKVEKSGLAFYLEARAFADSEVQKATMNVIWSGQITDIYWDLKEKSTKYGHLGCSYVIALWSPENPTDEGSELSFLFGELAVQFEVLTEPGQVGSPDRVVRYSNGLFVSAPRVSAVAIYEYIRLNQERKHDFRVYHNPEAEFPLDRSVFTGYPQADRQEVSPGGYTIKWEV